MTEVLFRDGEAILRGQTHFEPAHIFECGQCFRFNRVGNAYRGVAKGRLLYVEKRGGDIALYPCSQEDFEGVWREYFDLNSDYAEICAGFCSDERIESGMRFGYGMRILRQEPFETLISFIISQNNNIGRIKGIIERICAAWGEKRETDGESYHVFPEPGALAQATEQDMLKAGAGYRAKYIVQTALMVATGFNLERLRHMEYADAKREIMRLPGVGPKVADCILLFSLGHTRAFPVDVWVKKVMREYYGCVKPTEIEAFAEERFGCYAGIAQQYLFFDARENMPKKRGKQGKGRLE